MCQSVRAPGRVRIERGMSLLRALSLSGGLTEWADRKEVKVEPKEEEESFEDMSLFEVSKDDSTLDESSNMSAFDANDAFGKL